MAEPTERGLIEIVGHEHEHVRAAEVSEFLRHYKATYTALQDSWIVNEFSLGALQDEETRAHVQELSTKYLDEFRARNGPWAKLTAFRSVRVRDDLFLLRFTTESPYVLLFDASIMAGCLAVLLCGGEFELSLMPPHVRFHVDKSLGEALEDLRRAWRHKR